MRLSQLGGPGPDRLVAGLEHNRCTAEAAECVCGSQAGLPGADDHGVDHEEYCLCWGEVKKDSAAATMASAPRTRDVEA